MFSPVVACHGQTPTPHSSSSSAGVVPGRLVGCCVVVALGISGGDLETGWEGMLNLSSDGL